MKKLLLCLFTGLLAAPVLAQDLSLKYLLKLRQMETGAIHQKLSEKGWEFIEDSKPTAEVMGKAVWAFNPVGESATAWVVLYYTNTSPARLLYNISGGRTIPKIHKQVYRQKMELLEEGSQLERVQFLSSYTDYQNDSCVIRLLSYQKPGYGGIKIFRKEDYFTAKKKGRL